MGVSINVKCTNFYFGYSTNMNTQRFNGSFTDHIECIIYKCIHISDVRYIAFVINITGYRFDIVINTI